MTLSRAPRTRDLATTELTTAESGQIRALLWAAFEPDDEGFSEDDWQHALGGRHFLVEVGDEIVAHAAVVARTIEIGGRPLLLLAILLIFIGFQFVTMGLLGEMLARTYHESQDRPVFVVGEILEERNSV